MVTCSRDQKWSEGISYLKPKDIKMISKQRVGQLANDITRRESESTIGGGCQIFEISDTAIGLGN